MSVLIGILAAQAVMAKTVTVKELGISPSVIVNIDSPGFYNGPAYAGIIKLEINGKPMDGFCIDLYDFSSGTPQTYTIANLASTPEPPGGPMGTENARIIKNLWALNYAGARNDADQAAALQVAIWDVVIRGGANTAGTPSITPQLFGAFSVENLINAASSFTGPGASLVALTSQGFQDYIVLHVPDGGTTTLLLMGFAICGLSMVSLRYNLR